MYLFSSSHKAGKVSIDKFEDNVFTFCKTDFNLVPSKYFPDRFDFFFLFLVNLPEEIKKSAR